VFYDSPGSHFAQGFREQPELIRNALERRREHVEVTLVQVVGVDPGERQAGATDYPNATQVSHLLSALVRTKARTISIMCTYGLQIWAHKQPSGSLPSSVQDECI
jgi:hypothetical protein